MKRQIFLSIFAAGLVFLTSGCAGSTPAAAGNVSSGAGAKVIKLGVSTDIKPYSYLDGSDQLAGYDRDVLEAIDKALPQYTFQYTPVGESSAVQIGTESGKYDVGVNYYFENPTRQQKFLFQETAYGYVNLLAITKKGAPAINSFDEVVGKNIYPLMAASGVPPIVIRYNNAHKDRPIKYGTIDTLNEADMLKAVATGQYDLALENSTPFNVLQQTLHLDLVGGKPLSHEGFYFLVNKNETQLNSDLNQEIIKLKNDGTLSKLSQKWLGEDVFASDTSSSSK